jgi:hypothetical protein
MERTTSAPSPTAAARRFSRTSADVADREHAAARLMTIRIDLNGEDA